MTPIAWLLGLLLPACGGVGADRVAPTPPLDVAHLERPRTPNTALAAPADAPLRPDIVTRTYPVAPPRLLAAVEQVAEAMPRTWRLDAAHDTGGTARFVARSAVLNFPDIVSVQVLGRGDDASALVLYSRSVYGRSDFGVNRRRLQAWIAALDGKLSVGR